MKRNVLSLCLAFALLLCGCGKESGSSQDTVQTATTSTHTTTTAITDTSVATTTTAGKNAVDTTTNTESAATTDTPVSTTSGHPVNTTATSTTSTTASSSATNTQASTTISTTAPANATTFKATIRDNIDRRPVSGVIVSVWNSPDYCLGFATTDQNGVALITVPKQSTYRVRLSLPQGYEGETEYRFTTTTVNITIRKAAVQNELDHSQAQYDVGKTMTDFSLTDTDGNAYRLSTLLKEKKLIILDFWFASCEPCKMEFPFFDAAAQKYSDDVTLLAVNPIDSVNTIKVLRNQLNAKPSTSVTFPMLKDTCNLYLGFDVLAYPTTVFIDSTGRIVDIHVGAFPTEDALFAAIEQYLH